MQDPYSGTETYKPYPETLCIHELFEQQVRRTPDATALVGQSCAFTYRALNAHTNQLARILRQRGIGPEAIVGCYLSRSVGVVQCMLAILKAGGAYLLLDPNLPGERLRYMIDDAEPSLIVADVPPPQTVRDAGIPIEMLSDAMQDATVQRTGDVRSGTHPSNAAYIAYTSGSTGRPKGVVITHKSTVNHSYAFSRLFQLTSKDCVPIMAPITFDMATEEIVPPLMSGCQLTVSSSDHTSMAAFHSELLAQNYSILNIPAPLWHIWTEYLRDRELPLPLNLRLVVVGSDKIYTSRFMDWKGIRGAHRVKWVAAYGTTETTVTSSFYTTAWDDDLTDEPTIPIGKPMANTFLYVLDERGRPVKQNEVGELYVGGHGVARGYHKRPELTRERFVSDPFSSEAGARMYRTGDLARFRPDGNIVCLGRKDGQVKLNGLRIELGEIEAVLSEHPAINEAAVVLRNTPDEGEGYLAAFVTLRSGFDLPHDLQTLIGRRLHPHMIPKQFTVLSRLPLNASGKLDRNVLKSSSTKKECRFA